MNEQKLSESQAQEALDSMRMSQQSLIVETRPSVFISAVMSLSFGMILFGYGMTEHENLWALAMWGGAIVFALSTALYVYTYRIQGVKVSLLPRSSFSEKLNIYAAFVFAGLGFGSRYLRTDWGIEFAPYVCALAAAMLFFYLQRRYPTGESTVEKS